MLYNLDFNFPKVDSLDAVRKKDHREHSLGHIFDLLKIETEAKNPILLQLFFTSQNKECWCLQ